MMKWPLLHLSYALETWKISFDDRKITWWSKIYNLTDSTVICNDYYIQTQHGRCRALVISEILYEEYKLQMNMNANRKIVGSHWKEHCVRLRVCLCVRVCQEVENWLQNIAKQCWRFHWNWAQFTHWSLLLICEYRRFFHISFLGLDQHIRQTYKETRYIETRAVSVVASIHIAQYTPCWH